MKKQNSAFTMIELMITLLIVFILATVAMVAYNQYVNRAKMAEGHEMINAITKAQATYYLEHKEFVTALSKPHYVPNSKSSFGPETGLVNDDLVMAGWQRLGYPIGVGTMVSFNYTSIAGKNNSAGAQLSQGCTGPGAFTSVNCLYQSAGTSGVTEQSGVTCLGTIETSSYVSPTGKSDYSWAVISTFADFSKSTTSNKCTSLVKVVETATNGNLVLGNPVQVINAGE